MDCRVVSSYCLMRSLVSSKGKFPFPSIYFHHYYPISLGNANLGVVFVLLMFLGCHSLTSQNLHMHKSQNKTFLLVLIFNAINQRTWVLTFDAISKRTLARLASCGERGRGGGFHHTFLQEPQKPHLPLETTISTFQD